MGSLEEEAEKLELGGEEEAVRRRQGLSGGYWAERTPQKCWPALAARLPVPPPQCSQKPCTSPRQPDRPGAGLG